MGRVLPASPMRRRFSRTASEFAVLSRRPALCCRGRTASSLAHHAGHPTPRSKYTLDQCRKVKVRIKQWPMQSKPRRRYFHIGQFRGSCTHQPLGQVHGYPKLQPIIQYHNNAGGSPVIACSRRVRLPLETRLHTSLGCTNFRISQSHEYFPKHSREPATRHSTDSPRPSIDES